MEEPRKSARERLLEKRAALDAQLRVVEAREKEEQRRLDTRRKVLAGAVVLEEAGKRPEFHQELMRMLDQFLIRAQDRKLFELSPIAPPGTVVEGSQSIELLEKVGEIAEEISRIA